MDKLKQLYLGASLGLVALVPGLAHATYTAQVYTSITDNVTAEITAAMPVVLAIGGTLIGIGVGFRLVRKAAKF